MKERRRRRKCVLRRGEEKKKRRGEEGTKRRREERRRGGRVGMRGKDPNRTAVGDSPQHKKKRRRGREKKERSGVISVVFDSFPGCCLSSDVLTVKTV